MENIDFTSMIKKYPLLSLKDVSFLNNFFNSEEVQKILSKTKFDNKGYTSKKIFLNILIFLILIFSSIILLKNFIDGGLLNVLLIIIILICFVVIIMGILSSVFGKKPESIKNLLMPLFVSKMNLDFSYTPKGNYYKGQVINLSSIDFIKKYSRIDKKEDSIKYKIKSEGKDIIDIYGAEIQTSKKIKTKHSYRYVKNNHFYILKVVFNNPKFKIKTPIKLVEDIANNYIKKILTTLGIQLSIVGTFLALISGDENSDGYIKKFLELCYNNIEITVIFLLGMFFIIFFIYSYFRGSGRVRVENIEFEKKFDIYSKDQIESRQLLTPSFMYRLVDFVNKIERKRVYELYFHDNYFYLKYNIMATNSIINLNVFGSNSYMEFHPYKSIYKNMEKLVEFYLEMKNITQLSKELKLFYYDKGIMSKEIIKGGDVNKKPDMNHNNNKNFIFF